MAVDLDAEVRRRKIADALTNGDDDSDSSEETDATDSTEETPAPEEPAAEPAAQASRREAGFLSFSDYSGTPAASPTPSPARVTYPTIAEDQPAPDYVPAPAPAQPVQPETAAAQPETVPAGHIDLGPPDRNIYTDPDTGGRYTIDPDTRQMVPHAELATAADKAAQPPGGVELPRAVVTGAAPAPDRLTQVERGELVGLPWHPAHPEQLEEAPSQLTQVERGQLVPRAIPVQPPDTLSQVEKGIALPPKVQPAQPVAGTAQAPAVQAPVTQQAPSQASARQAAGFLSFDDYSHPKPAVAQQPSATQQPAAPGQVPVEPQIDLQSQSYTKGRIQEPTKLVLHSSDGTSVQGDVNTLTGAEPGHRVSANYYVTRDGRVMHFVSENDTAWHAGADRYGGNGNAYTLGIEQQHVDGKQDWPDAQVRAAAQTAAGILARHPNMTIDDVIGHNDLAGERKQDPVDYPWPKFRKYVAEALGQPAGAQQAAAPSAQPVTKLKNGFYQDEKPGDFLTGRVTTFATEDDIASGQDNGVGSPHLGTLDTTQVAGVALPHWVLQQYFGNSTAAMRQARVDVVDPQTGRRLRVPIVDIGPGEGPENAGVIADMTPALARYFGGDKNLSIRIVPKAGPDVMKNSQLFADEQAAIKNGFDSSALDPKRQVIGPQFATRAQTPAEATEAQQRVQQAVQKQQDMVSALPEVKGGNVIEAYNRLDQGVEGVSSAYIKNVQASLKQQAITQIRQKYPEIKTDEDAWKVAQTPAGISTFTTELGTSFYAAYTRADLAFNQMMQGADANRLTDFARALHPDYKPEGLTAFVKSITDIKDPTQRSQMIGKLMDTLPESTQSMFDAVSLADSADRIGSPAYQKAQSEALAAKRAYLDHLESPDPRLKGNWLEKGVQLVGSLPATVTLGVIPGGTSLFAAQIYLDSKDKLRAEHSDWSEAQINDTAQKSTIAQLAPQALLAAIGAGQLGQVTELVEKWTGGKVSFGGISRAMEGVENPALRAVIGAFPHIATGTGAGVAQQMAGNIAEGRPLGEGVMGAAFGGAVMGAPAGVAHGIGAALRPGERAAPAVVQPPPPRPVIPAEILGPERSTPTSALTPWYQPGPIVTRLEGPPVHSVSSAEILGPETAETTPWYKPGPLITRAAERTAFSPEELASKVEALRQQGWTPDQIQQAIESLSPEPSFARQTLHLGEEAPIAQVRQNLYQEGMPEQLQRAEDFRNRGVFLGDAGQVEFDQAMAAQARQNLYPIDRQGNPKISESEPWVSQIANRFTAERMGTGELGAVQPGVGVTKEEMLARGLKMSPEQINQHVSNVMNDVGGNPRDQAAAIRTEEARLSQRSRQASLAFEADPKNAQLRLDADNALKDLTDFHNGPVAKLKNNWHAQGVGLQGELPVDLSSYNGLRDAYLRDVGKAPPPSAEPAMRAAAKRVRDAADAESAAMRNLGAEIERQSARRRLPTDEELRMRIMDRVKDMPCST
jgi:N-acetyl-anhydromuramyl-L-alanine amidase AmpD